MEPLVVYDRLSIWRRRLIRCLGALILLTMLILGLQYSGLLAFERYSGFYAPTWDLYGKQVFYIQRDTLGVIRGPGRIADKNAAPAIRAWVLSDQISLRRLNMEDGRVEILRQLDETPASGRILHTYRGHVFGPLRAQINVRDGGLDFMARIDLPDESGAMVQSPAAAMYQGGYSDNPLAGDLELMVVPGRESFPAAILAVRPDGSHDVLLRNRQFDRLYPEPLPAAVLQQWSRRRQVEQQREVERHVADLVREYRARGLSDTEIEQALLAEGYIPVGVRMIASRVDAPEPGERVFDIDIGTSESGLLVDIRRAIDAPGKVIVRQRPDHITYQDDATGQELDEWLAAGNRSFIIRSQDRHYRLLLIH